MPILPNGKNLLDKALPPQEGGHVLMLREDHSLPSHLHYLGENMQELASAHNVGTIGMEYSPFMMLFLWAHQDHRLAPTAEESERRLKQAFMAYCAFDA